ncbi:MAG TPA: hypothetical protein EYP85_08850 [Armatimonadetes bacterium]|nr:hypothetical protein [Armatimonadota bacterium]
MVAWHYQCSHLTCFAGDTGPDLTALRLRSGRWSLTLGLLVVGLAVAAFAAEPVTPVYPCRFVAAPVRCDGWLDEPAWTQAVPAGPFLQAQFADTFATPQTQFRALYDDQALYLAVVSEEPQMSRLVTQIRQRDGPVYTDDSIEVFLDPTHTHRHYFHLIVNAAGVVFDEEVHNTNWDADWRAAVGFSRGLSPCPRAEAEGWVLEMAVPFAALGVEKPSAGEIWGLNVCRERYAGGKQELSNWAFTGGNFHTPQWFGDLCFLPLRATERFVRRAQATDEPSWSRLLAASLAVHERLRVDLMEGTIALQGAKFLPLTYRAQAAARWRERGPALGKLMAEMRRLARQPGAQTFAARVESLLKRQADLERTATSSEPLDPWGFARWWRAVQELERTANDLIWELRLEALLASP